MYDPVLALVALLILTVGMFSYRLEASAVTPPIIFLLAGIILGPWGLGLLDLKLDHMITRHAVEITLILVLFTDGAATPTHALAKEYNATFRLLWLGIPLSVLIGTLIARPLFTGLSWWDCALLAAVLTPTDAALGQVALSHPKIPENLRESLTVEAGLNDGLMVPVILFVIACGSMAAGQQHLTHWTLFIAEQVGLGLLIGAAGGAFGRWGILRAQRAHRMEPIFEQLAMLALALLTFACAELVHGNGLVAVFTAGITLRHWAHHNIGSCQTFASAQARLLSLITFLLFGALLLPQALASASWQTYLYALLSLTVIRMISSAISLIGTGSDWKTKVFVGWMGPRGIASLLFGLVVLQAMNISHRVEIFNVVVVTVGLSILLHGLLAPTAAIWYSRGRHDSRTVSS